MWRALLAAIGRADLLESHDPKSIMRNAGPEMREAIEAWTRERTKFEVMETLGAAGVPTGPVLDSGEIYANEHLRERGMLIEIEHPERGPMTLLGCPIRLSESPAVHQRAPLLGEHTRDVLTAELGLSAAQLEALAAAGVI